MKLKGKVALVTGAGRSGTIPGRRRGFGAEICKRLALQGADIVVNDFTGPFPELSNYDLATKEEMNAVVEEMKALGVRAIGIDADVGDAGAVDRMVKTTLKEFGHINILVNNAGVGVAGAAFVDIEERFWDLEMRIIGKGTFLCCKAIGKVMIQQGKGGRIVNISSNTGKTGPPFCGAYAAAKHAVVGITRALSNEIMQYGINVNAVCPGFCETHFMHMKEWGVLDPDSPLRKGTVAERLEIIKQRNPAHRLGTIEDVAALVEFLCLPESSFINGQSILIDGGGATI